MGVFDKRKLIFSALMGFLFLIVASTTVYNMVGSILGLEYDGENNSRTTLLLIHSFVYSLVAFIAVNVYNPSI